MAPLRGWGPRGQRLTARVPHGHWKTLTFIAALRVDRVDAPWVIDGPINGELFTLYVEKILAPTLTKGDVVILDNLGRKAGQRDAPSAKREPTCSFCRPTAPTSTLSSSSSPSSSISCEWPSRGPSRRHGERSDKSSTSSPQPNARTISKTQDMLPYENSML
jgi:hypothetical protein